MPAAAVTAAVGVYGANQAKKGAKAQGAANDAAISEQRRQFDLTREDMAPWMQAGGWALGKQQDFLKGDRSGFENSPDYLYARDEMIGNLDRTAASRGRLMAGAHSVDLMRHANGLANQNMNNYWNRLAGLSNTGQVTAGQLGQFGANTSSNIGRLLLNGGDIRASSYGVNGQLAAGLGGMFNNWYQGNRAANPGGTGWYLGNNPGRG